MAMVAQFADRTFWQNQRNEAEVALSGLEIVRRVIATCLDEFGALRSQDAHPHVEALRRIQPSGILDQSQWPPTGRQLVSWDVNILIARLRILYLRHTNAANDTQLAETEAELTNVANQMRELMARINAATNECTQDRDRANRTLVALDEAT
jgi:hypothetical protein